MKDWDQFRCFLAVAREGAVRAARDHLGVSHSAVLRRLALLGQQLGTQLLEKMPSGTV
jgi:DNA-binding transcriptional LysR family regulator